MLSPCEEVIGRGDVILDSFQIETATNFVPGTVISTLHILSHLILMATLASLQSRLLPESLYT